MAKISFLTGAAVGYVLGARAGRQRYEQLSRLASNALGSPQAQRAKGVVTDQATHLASQAKDLAKGKAAELTGGSAKSSSDGGAYGAGVQVDATTDTDAGLGYPPPNIPVAVDAGEQSDAPTKGSGYTI